MKATKEQIIAEANRRAVAQGYGAPPVEHFIVDVVCENWTPPEPVVDPDVLAFREWMVATAKSPGYREEVLAGKWDRSSIALGFLAGARMAREQAKGALRDAIAYIEFQRPDAVNFDHLISKFTALLKEADQ